MAKDELIQAARDAREKSLAIYSGFRVGAALETADGKIYQGCNIESSSYSLTICAERVALFKALSEGERKFTRLVLTADSPQLCPPCGACRQVLWDFAPNLTIIMVNDNDEAKTFPLRDLLPKAFDMHFLK